MAKDQTLEAEIKKQPVEGSEPGKEEKDEPGLHTVADAVAEETVKDVEKVETEEPEAAEEAEEEVDELTALSQQLEAAQAQADEYLDDLRRERAAFQNYKKRQENERSELRKMAQANLWVQILPSLDDMERALETIPDEQADQPWVEGILLIQRKLQTTLENNDVAVTEAEPGQPFDPFVHEAVSYEEHENYQEGQIIAVVHKGYKMGERVLRPAMVRVAK